MATRRHGTNQRDDSAPHAVNGRQVSLYTYRGTELDGAGPWPDDERCGTYAGWNAHKRNGEPPCPDCQRAQTDYLREWRLRTGRTRTKRVRLTAAELAMLRTMRGASGGR